MPTVYLQCQSMCEYLTGDSNRSVQKPGQFVDYLRNRKSFTRTGPGEIHSDICVGLETVFGGKGDPDK